MDYNKVRERAEKTITPIVEGLGFEVVEVECKYANKANNITVYIHKKGGITLDDCELVSKALDAPLDNDDVTDGEPYALNISSPGLDRPIVTDNDLTRNLGAEVEAVFHEAAGKKKKVVGTLDAFDAETISLTVKTAKETLRRADIKKLSQYVDFKKIR